MPEIIMEFNDRDIPITILNTRTDDPDWNQKLRKELRKMNLCATDVVVALPGWVEVALEELGIDVPEPPDYPDCL